ncbi:MAG: energy-coupling factor transporter transmembrane component T family protein [Bryobacteraceae bacterium]
MHHFELDEWSRGSSLLHRLDARAKIAGLILFLLAVAFTPSAAAPWLWLFAFVPLIAIGVARIPLRRALAFSAAVLPFAFVFALVQAPTRGLATSLALLEKSYVSALAALALVGTTPLPKLAQGLMSLGAPRFLALVVQFLYRYLFLVSEQAQHMRLAAASRGVNYGRRFQRRRLRAAAGALAALFARSHQRAEATYHAMLARGFAGRFHLTQAPAFKKVDFGYIILIVIASLSIHKVIVLFTRWSL